MPTYDRAQFTLNITKLSFELRRAIKGKARWKDLTHSYLRELVEIEGLGHKQANEVRRGIRFKFFKNKQGHNCLQIIDTTHGTEMFVAWDQEGNDAST